jgi:hypothetical protein
MKSVASRLVVCCLTLLFCTSAHATGENISTDKDTPDSTNPKTISQIDPFVDALVKQVSDYLSTAKSFSVRSNATFEEVLPTGQKIQISRTADVLVRRPDRLQAEIESDQGITRFYYDGKIMSRFDLDKNVYASIDVPDNLEAALDDAMERFQIDAPLADLIAGNIHENFIAKTESGSYVGLHYLDGNKYHHLALSNKNVDFQVWITDDTAPLIRKIVITYRHLDGAPQFTAILSDWNFNPRTPDMVFEFFPPIDADKIEYLPVKTSQSGEEK